MLFSTTVFLLGFLPGILIIYYGILRKRDSRNVLLLLASLFFYAWGEPWFVFIMIFSILANYGFGLLVEQSRKKPTRGRWIIFFMLTFNLGIMFVFKYLMFSLYNISSLFLLDLSVPTIILPIGISFFTFQAMSYVFDVYRQKGEVQKNPLHVGLYIAFFPQLIAGPIVRYETVAQQILNRKENWDDFSKGSCRFILGLGKKVILANNLAIVADQAFSASPGELSVFFAWLGAIAYTLQIFFDFSGYSDMAIGLGQLFGFHFLENFNYPYISKSISEFWRRWHISLGTWFRDYLYFPLGGSRVKSKLRLVFNLFVVWLLTGIWHGANWTFVVWGLMYFLLIALEKLLCFKTKAIKKGRLLNFFKHGYVLFFVSLGWVIFRSDTLSQGIFYLSSMFGLMGNPLFDTLGILYFNENCFFFILALLFSVPCIPWLKKRIPLKKGGMILIPMAYMVLLTLSVSYIIKGSYNPFIYFNF